MIKRIRGLIALLFIFAILLNSCDPREADLPSWESEYLVPLLNADFNIEDITLSKNLQLKEDSSGVLSFIYVSDKDEVKLADFLTIGDESAEFNLPGLPNTIDDVYFSAIISPADLGVSTGVDVYVPPFEVDQIDEQADITEYFHEAIFQSGQLELTIQNGFPFEVDPGVIIEIINADDNSTVFLHSTNSPIPAKGSYVLSPPYDLTSVRLSGQIQVRIKNIKSSGIANGEVKPEDALGLSVALVNLSLKSAPLQVPPFETPEIQEDIAFDLPMGAKLTTINIKSGLLTGEFITNLNFPLLVHVRINSATQHGNQIESNIDLWEEKRLTLDLSDASIDLTGNGAYQSNTLSVSVSLSSSGSETPVTIDFEEPIVSRLSVSSLVPSSVFGYLGTYQTELQERISLDFFKQIVSGSIDFSSPSVKAFITNEIGTGVALKDNSSLYIKGANTSLFPGKEIILRESLKDMAIYRASNPGEGVESKLVMDGKNEPDFGKFLSLLPSEVSFSFPVQIGTTIEDLSQFAIDTSRLSGHIEIEFPLEFRSRDLTMTDSLDFDVVFDNNYAEMISGELNTHVTNHFPIELLMQMYFLDEHYQVLDSLFLTHRIIEPGEVNNVGKVTKPSLQNFVVGFDKAKLDNLTEAAFARPIFILNTTEQEYIKVYSDSRVNLKVNGDFVIHLKNE